MKVYVRQLTFVDKTGLLDGLALGDRLRARYGPTLLADTSNGAGSDGFAFPNDGNI